MNLINNFFVDIFSKMNWTCHCCNEYWKTWPNHEIICRVLDKNVIQKTVQNHNQVAWRVFYVTWQFQYFLSLQGHSLEEDADASVPDVCQIKPCEEEESLTNSWNPCMEPIKDIFMKVVYHHCLSEMALMWSLNLKKEVR